MDDTIALGPFVVGPCIGRGGMGKVFEAGHTDTGTPVAIKVIAGDGDRASRQAFHREVQAHAGLVHPGVIYLFDYGTIDEEAARASGGVLSARDSYVAMELAERGTVRDQMPYRDWEDVRHLLLQILDALSFSHARQVIHRDLKPENLLLFDDAEQERPRVKLADFGLAHALEQIVEREERDLEQFSGTPHYMAPEQLRSKWRRYGPWTDLYALGCVAWHLVCGQPPYTGDSLIAVAMKHCDAEFPDLRPRFAIPDGVEDWIRRAMAIDPTNRFQYAADAAWALPRSEAAEKRAKPPRVTDSAPADPASPTTMMQTLHWQQSRALTDGATTLISDTVDLASADTVAREPVEPSWDQSAQSGEVDRLEAKVREVDRQIHGADAGPPVPPSWRTPDRQRLPTALVNAGLGLFGLREIPLVDREKERDLIWQALGEVAQKGCLRVVFLAGEAGVGKSRLARWMATRAHEVGAAQVYRAIYAPGTRKAATGMAGMIQGAFHTWKLGRGQLYQELCERLPEFGEDDDTVELDARALTELVYPSADGGEIEGPRFQFANRDHKHTLMARVLARLGRRRAPVVWLDDLHQDPDAVGLVEHLVTSKSPPTGLILATVRSDILTENSELQRRIADLTDSQLCEHIELGPIGTADHRALIDRMLPLDPELGEKLAGRTEGNPLFAHQLLGDLIAGGNLQPGPAGFQIANGTTLSVPDDIHQMWAERIDRLVSHYPPEQRAEAREAIALAAALGREIAAQEWRAVCADAGFEVPERLVGELVVRGLARHTDDGWSFAHGLLVESIGRDSARRGRWSEHHRRCAAALERLYPEQPGETARRRANHWLTAGEDERALGPLREATDHHRNIADLNAASSLCDLHDRARQRLGIGDDDRRTVHAWLQRAKIARLHAELDKSERIFERCEACSRNNRWDDLLAEVTGNRAHLAGLRGDVESGLEIGQQALQLFEARDDQSGTARALRCIGWLQRRSGDYRRAHQNFQRAARITREFNDVRQHVASLRMLSFTYQDQREYDRALELLSRALEISQDSGNPMLTSNCLNSLGENYRFVDDLPRAEEFYRQALVTDTRAGLREGLHIYPINLGIVACMQGKYVEGRDRLEDARQTVIEKNLTGWVGYVHACTLFAVAGLDDWNGFDHHLDCAREHLKELPVFSRDIADCCAGAGRLAADAGEVERAQCVYEMAREQWVELAEPDEVADIDARLEALRAPLDEA